MYLKKSYSLHIGLWVAVLFSTIPFSDNYPWFVVMMEQYENPRKCNIVSTLWSLLRTYNAQDNPIQLISNLHQRLSASVLLINFLDLADTQYWIIQFQLFSTSWLSARFEKSVENLPLKPLLTKHQNLESFHWLDCLYWF